MSDQRPYKITMEFHGWTEGDSGLSMQDAEGVARSVVNALAVRTGLVAVCDLCNVTQSGLSVKVRAYADGRIE